MRKRGGAESGAAIRVAREHGACHRPAVPGTVGGKTAEGAAEAYGRGRNPHGQEGQVHYRGEQPETGEPLWFGRERKKETLDEFFRTQLRSSQRGNIEAACVDCLLYTSDAADE